VTTIRILLADDHRVVREGLRILLEADKDFEVVGETGDGRAAVTDTKALQPDVVVMDVGMPGLNGVEATLQILAENPRVKILALSMHSDTRFVTRMLRAGARGYLLKDCAFEEIARAVKTIVSGRMYLGTAVMGAVIQDYLRRTPDAELNPAPILTTREREVLQLLAEGTSTKQTASLLSISIKTVETHRKQIMDKLNLHSVAALTKYAIREGLTGLD
jgi:DNA-binding NarL/FixJ family response regulator